MKLQHFSHDIDDKFASKPRGLTEPNMTEREHAVFVQEEDEPSEYTKSSLGEKIKSKPIKLQKSGMLTKIHRKRPVPEFLFDKKVVIKKTMQLKYFPVNFAKFIKTPFLPTDGCFKIPSKIPNKKVTSQNISEILTKIAMSIFLLLLN